MSTSSTNLPTSNPVFLGDTLLYAVLSQAAIASMFRFPPVSRRFANICRQVVKQSTHVNLGWFPTAPSDLASVLNHFPNVQSLDLAYITQVSPAADFFQAFRVLETCCPFLNTLFLPSFVHANWLIQPATIGLFRRLHIVLTLEGKSVYLPDSELAKLEVPISLRQLRTGGSNVFSNLLIMGQQGFLPNLQLLEVDEAEEDNVDWIAFEQVFVNLRVLKLPFNSPLVPTFVTILVEYTIGKVEHESRETHQCPTTMSSFYHYHLSNAFECASRSFDRIRSLVRNTRSLTIGGRLAVENDDIFKWPISVSEMTYLIQRLDIRSTLLNEYGDGVKVLGRFLQQTFVTSLSLNVYHGWHLYYFAFKFPKSIIRLELCLPPHSFKRVYFEKVATSVPNVRHLRISSHSYWYFKKFAESTGNNYSNLESLTLKNVVLGAKPRPGPSLLSLKSLRVITDPGNCTKAQWASTSSFLQRCPNLLELVLPLQCIGYKDKTYNLPERVSLYNQRLTSLTLDGINMDPYDGALARRKLPMLVHFQQPPQAPPNAIRQFNDFLALDVSVAVILTVALLLL
ncbi:hypothetical protein RCL1_003814 [Eukaryota sp. TZLM3-RCL]